MHTGSRDLSRAVNKTARSAYRAASAHEKGISCPDHIRRTLRDSGLRLTRQRLALAKLLGRPERRRVSAEALYSDVLKAHYPVSRATVCNALRQFERAGVIRRIAAPRSKKAWFVVNLRLVGLRGSDVRVTPQSALRPSKAQRAPSV